MSIKIIPREKVYFRDWVEKNGIEVEVRELESGKYSAWTAAIVNAAFVADTTGHGSSPDVALEMLEKNLADIPRCKWQTESRCRFRSLTSRPLPVAMQ